MKTIIYACSNPDYAPLEVWKKSIEQSRGAADLEVRHEEYTAPAGLADERRWYWYIANKLRLFADFLEKDGVARDVVIFSDCDVVLFPNPGGWSEALKWFSQQPLPAAFMRDVSSPAFNTGFYMVQGKYAQQMAFFLRMIYDMTTKTDMFYGDQTALNYMAQLTRFGYIPPRFLLGGESPNLRATPSTIFYHRVASGRDGLNKVETGVAGKEWVPDFAKAKQKRPFAASGTDAFYKSKADSLLVSFQEGKEAISRAISVSTMVSA